MSKILEMQQIYKSFGKVDVLKGINFELEKGEVRALSNRLLESLG